MPISRINTNSIANNSINASDLLDASITAVKIISVANTQITGNIVSSQITSIGGSQITANTIANSAIQTGAVENYMNAAGLGFGMRNRIINGAMLVSQRNGTSSVTANDGSFFTDRFSWADSVDAKFTGQQSSTAPTGFINSLLLTSSSAYSISSSDYFVLNQNIEGLNVADLAWGTASASTVTLSFWVRSSLTGTFGGVINNSANDRSYAYTYTINSANTFEYKTVTIAGDQSGTWLTTNGLGIRVRWGLGVGSTRSATAGSWNAGLYLSATGATSVVGTNGATFYITGVQLEKGSTATSFDYRSYGTELALCQRYFYVRSSNITVPFSNTTDHRFYLAFKSTMRTTPTVTATQGAGGGTQIIEGQDVEGVVIGVNGSSSRPVQLTNVVATAEL